MEGSVLFGFFFKLGRFLFFLGLGIIVLGRFGGFGSLVVFGGFWGLIFFIIFFLSGRLDKFGIFLFFLVFVKKKV